MSMVSCTARCVTLGNLRNFHRGGGEEVECGGERLEKRAQVRCEQEN